MPDLAFCITEVLKESFGGLDAETKKDLGDMIKSRHQELIEHGSTPQDAQNQVLKDIAAQSKLTAAFEAAQAFQLANAIHDKLTFIDSANEMDESKPFLARISGIPNRAKKWARAFGGSTNLRGKTLVATRFGRFETELEGAGVLKQFSSKAYREKYAGDILEEIGNPGGSKNPVAKKIGEITAKYYQETITGCHEAGLPFKDVEGFMSSYHRDPERMLQVEDTRMKRLKYRMQPGKIFNYKEDYEKSYQRWRDTELLHLDKDKTFGANANNVKKIDKFMRHVYDHQVLEQPNSSPAEKDEYVFRGLARIAARKKQLFYKDGYAFAAANKAYGYGDVGHLIQNTLETGAKMEAMAKDWTPQCYKAYAKVKSVLVERIHNKPAHLRAKLIKNLNFVDRAFDEVTGLAKRPVSAQSAKMTNSVLCWEAMSTYGSSIARAISDIPGWQNQLHQSGHGWIKSFYTPFEHLGKRLTGIETTAKTVKEVGRWSKNVTGDVMSRFASSESLTGLQTKVMGTFFNMNLIKPWDNFMKDSFLDFSRELWDHSKTSFDKLHPDFQFNLERYGLNEREWDLIRKNNFQLPDNRKVITPDDPLQYSKEDIADYLGKKEITDKEHKDTQVDLHQRMAAMYIDRNSFIYLTGDPIEQAKMRMGSKPGTTMGNINRLMIQSHAWPVGIWNRILGNIFSNIMDGEGITGKLRGAKKDLPGLALYIAGIHTTTYLSQVLVNAVHGKFPPKFFSAQSELNTFSEIAGIYGQVISTVLSRMGYGKDPLISAAGPAIRNLDELLKVISKAMHGQKFGSPLYHLIKGNTPGLNLIWVKPFFDYLIGYYIQETMHPGAMRRLMLNHQKRVRDEGEADYFLPPSSSLGV